jgi:hypothetical protein
MSDKRAQKAEENLPYESAKALSARFTKDISLRVGSLSGDVRAGAEAKGAFGTARFQRTCPYSVDYFLKLPGGLDRLRWNEQDRVMVVRLPDVTIGEPNIDERNCSTDVPKGFWVSRKTTLALQKQVSARQFGQAGATAKEQKHMDKARENGREAVETMVGQSLTAAGVNARRVEAYYPFEGRRSSKRWDESTPLEEILRQSK